MRNYKNYLKATEKKYVLKATALILLVFIQFSTFAQLGGLLGCDGSGGGGVPTLFTGPGKIYPKAGDEPCTATYLKTGLSCTQYSIDTATASAAPPVPACWSAANRDQWLTFTASAQDMTISTDALLFNLGGSEGSGYGLFNSELALYSTPDGKGNCADPLTYMACDQNSGINAATNVPLTANFSNPKQAVIEITGLTPGSIYFIRIQGAGGGATGGNYCISAFDTYTPGSRQCEPQNVHPNSSACGMSAGNSVINSTSSTTAVVNGVQPNAYVPLGQSYCGGNAPGQYGTWTDFVNDSSATSITVTNNTSGTRVYTFFSSTTCLHLTCMTFASVASGASTTFTGLTPGGHNTGTTYYILTTLPTGDLTAEFTTDLCVTNNVVAFHPPTQKNVGGVAGAGGTVNTDLCSKAYGITQKQPYQTNTYNTTMDGSAGSCGVGNNVWFYWDVPATVTSPASAFFQMWNKNCTGGPATRGTDLIVALGPTLGTADPCASGNGCYDINTPTANVPSSAGHNDWSTNVGWDPSAYSCRYYGVFTGDQNAICDFSFEVNDSPSLHGVQVSDATICQGQSAVLTGSYATGYEWATGETTASITVTPSVTSTYTVTATAGASGYDVAKVTVIPYPFTITATPGAICTGVTTTTLTVSSTSTYTVPPEYAWTPSASLTPATGTSVAAHPAGPQTYTVVATIGRGGTFPGCKASTTTVVTQGATPISVNAGVVCPGQSAILTASGANTYTWAPNTALSATTGASVTATPGVATTYTVTGSVSGCTGTATSLVTLSPTPTITVNSSSICTGLTASLLASGGVSYVWSDGSTANPFITPALSAPASYTVTGSNASGCSATAQANVTIQAGLSITVSGNTGVCIGGSNTLTAAGATNYNWSPPDFLSAVTGASPTSTPTVTTTYTVVGDANGCTGTQTAAVTVNPLDDASFHYSSATFCNVAGTYTPTLTVAGTGSYTISPAGSLALNAADGTINITTATALGPYKIMYTSTTNCTNTYTVTVTVVGIPDATFSYPLPAYCKNGTPNPVITQPGGSTPGTFSVTPVGLVFVSPTTGQIDLTASAPAAGPYTVTNFIAAGGGCPATNKTTTVTINPIPVVSVTSNTLCLGAPAVTITATGATTYTWAGGGTPAGATLSDSPGLQTTYTATGTTNGCSSTGSGTIYVNSLPTFTVTSHADCAGIPQTITATGATSYTWTGGVAPVPGGPGNQNLTDSPLVPSTTYVATGTTNGCSSTSQGIITVTPSPSVTVTNSATCLGFPATLTATAVNQTSITWSSGETAVFSITKNPGALGANTYTVTVTGANPACIDTAIATIFVNPNPVVTVTSSPDVCLGQTSTLTATGAATAYSWLPGGSALNPLTVVAPLGSTVYTVTGTITATGCTGTQTGTITVNPIPLVTVTPPQTICQGGTANITASGAQTYVWSPNIGATGDVTPPVGSNNSYTVTGTLANCSNTAVTNVAVNPLPTFTVSSTSVCAGVLATLIASPSGGGVTYTWIPGGSIADSITVSLQSSTTYTVTATTTSSCTATGTGAITVFPNPSPGFDAPQKITLSEANLTFSDKESTNAIIKAWLWNFGDSTTSILQNPQHIYADTGLFNICLNVVSNGGCVGSICKDIIIIPDLLVYIPNAFTPDGDGLNDGFGFKNSGLTSKGFEFRIFDRWGEQMYYTNDISGLWDGTFKGAPCQQDVYVYTILVVDNFGKEKKYLGNITLVR